MKRVTFRWAAAVAFAVAAGLGAAAQSPNQSLGEYARSVRKTKPAAAKSSAQVYDNDNLPTRSKLSVVGGETSQTPSGQAMDESAKPQDKDAKTDDKDAAKDETRVEPGQKAEDCEKAFEAWKQRIAEQKAKVDLLNRELNVLQGEYRIASADFYASTAQRVQNPNAFRDQDAKYKAQIAEKQKALDEAKAKLADLQDQAHKEGVPNSFIE